MPRREKLDNPASHPEKKFLDLVQWHLTRFIVLRCNRA